MRHTRFLAVVVSMLVASTTTFAQTPLGTGFTYQGRLDQSGGPANGSFPMAFKLWDAASGGAQIGPTLTFDGLGGHPAAVSVVNGVFDVSLDFGAGSFGANARWLEITVDGVTLSPRQAATPTPAALFSSAPWATNGNTISFSGGAVGIGTSVPTKPLEVNSAADCEIGLRSVTGAGRLWTLQSSSGSAAGQLAGSFQIIDRTANASRMFIDSTGKVGIGMVPFSTNLLSVNGDVYSPGLLSSQRVYCTTIDAAQLFLDAGIEFGKYDNNSDPIVLERKYLGADRSALRLTIGDNPGGGAAYDEFQIYAANSFQFDFTSDGRAFKVGYPGWEALSDARSKHDIEPLTGALDLVLQLRGRTFYYNDPNALGARAGRCIGFVAQEVEPIMPEWIGEEFGGMKTMHIAGFEALAVEALRDLHAEKEAEIAALRAEKDAQIRDLNERLARLEAMVGERGLSRRDE